MKHSKTLILAALIWLAITSSISSSKEKNAPSETIQESVQQDMKITVGNTVF